jgi:hypothetical protein
MAFKMKRPFKMKAPLKRAGLNIGRTKEPTLYYNSDTGPMKIHSPSALKAMEEEMPTEEGGMEEMMGTMGGGEEMGGPPPEAAEGATDPTEDEAEYIFGQEIEVAGDGKYQIDIEELGYGIAGLPDTGVIEVLDPDGVLGNIEEGGYVPDEDFTYEVKEGKVYITGERVLEEGE